MFEPKEPSASPDGPSIAVVPRPSPRSTLPSTSYGWLALLILAYLLPAQRLAPSQPAASSSRPVSAAAFERFVAVEFQTRIVFGMAALGGASASAGAAVAASQQQALDEVVAQYRVLANQTASPNSARRLLVLEHARDGRLDARSLDRELEHALRAGGQTADALAAEKRLWRDLYVRKRVAASEVAAHDRRLGAMRLGFLQNRARADLYAAAGDARRAQAFTRRFEQAAIQSVLRLFTLILVVVPGALAGLVFFGMFVVTLSDKRWRRVGRVPQQPQSLGWGGGLDAFLFYLATYRGAGLLVGWALPWFVVDPAALAPRTQTAIAAVLQFGTGVGAAMYLRARVRGGGGRSLADVGLGTNGALWANLGYGVAGYLATLPLVLALGSLSQVIFRHFPNTSPNPILPLLSAEQSPSGRLLIFAMVAVGAPVFEELFFRGALWSGLRARYGAVASVFGSAALFALVHPPSNWLPIFGLGIGLAVMRELRQSLIPCITAHLIQNSFTFILLSVLFGPT